MNEIIGLILLIALFDIQSQTVAETNLGQRSCVLIVKQSADVHYNITVTECIPEKPFHSPRCQSLENKVQKTLQYSYMEAVCCSGYREVRYGDEFKCEPYPAVVFQLFFTNKNMNCQEWKDIFHNHGIGGRFAIQMKNILASICSCNSTLFNVHNVQLLCIEKAPNIEIFQGLITTSRERNETQLSNDIETIALEEKEIHILNEELDALDNCTSCCIIISESDLGSTKLAEGCLFPKANAHSSHHKEEEVGGAIASIAVVILMAIVVAVVLYWYSTKARRGCPHEPEGVGDGGAPY